MISERVPVEPRFPFTGLTYLQFSRVMLSDPLGALCLCTHHQRGDLSRTLPLAPAAVDVVQGAANVFRAPRPSSSSSIVVIIIVIVVRRVEQGAHYLAQHDEHILESEEKMLSGRTLGLPRWRVLSRRSRQRDWLPARPCILRIL